LCLIVAEVKEQANDIVDTVKEKAAEVNDAAQKTADELKPVVNDAKEAGMFFEYSIN
jgi:hypothetical protein